MGGTNLLTPMHTVLNGALINSNLPRHVFVLTDGEIDDPKGTC